MIKSTVSKKVSHLWKYCRAQGKKDRFYSLFASWIVFVWNHWGWINCSWICCWGWPYRAFQLAIEEEDRMMMNLLHLVIFDLGWCPSITYPSIIWRQFRILETIVQYYILTKQRPFLISIWLICWRQWTWLQAWEEKHSRGHVSCNQALQLSFVSRISRLCT